MRIQSGVLFILFIAATNANAQISLTGTTYSESFTNSGTYSGTFSATIGEQTNIGTTGWVGTKIAGNGTGTTSVSVSNGGLNTGSLYSFGATADSDRALGAIASAGNIMGFGFKLTNNTGQVIQDLTVSFVQENWRSSTTTQNVIAASYAVNANAADASFLTTGTFTSASSLSLVGPDPVATNGALDGNLAGNQTNRNLTLTGLNLGLNEHIFFRWQDANEAGNDAGLAIDNFQISAVLVPVPEPASIIGFSTLGVAAVSWIRRRRS